jgi:hypothetical protein
MPSAPDKAHSSSPSQDYPAEKARQGKIVLRKRWQRVLFIGGLAGVVVLALVLRFLMWR